MSTAEVAKKNKRTRERQSKQWRVIWITRKKKKKKNI